jgi:hypothetical protein
MPVRSLLENISSKELTEWKAYYKLKDKLQKDKQNKGSSKINKYTTF